jgi:chromosome segregation ATPase
MISSSYEYLPTDKNFYTNFRKKNTSLDKANEEAVVALKHKLKTVEDNSSYVEAQFHKLQQRLNVLEEHYQQGTPSIIAIKDSEQEEDWKEMYYQENEAKEKIENQLDEAQQQLQMALHKIQEIENSQQSMAGIKSDYDARLNDLQSLQNNIGDLQRELEAAAKREKDLEILLREEINIKKQFAGFETERTSYVSTIEDLKQQIAIMHRKEAEMQKHLHNVNELESRIALYEEEKAKMIGDLELIMNQTKLTFSPKEQ